MLADLAGGHGEVDRDQSRPAEIAERVLKRISECLPGYETSTRTLLWRGDSKAPQRQIDGYKWAYKLGCLDAQDVVIAELEGAIKEAQRRRRAPVGSEFEQAERKAGGEVAYPQDIFYVCKKTLDRLREKFKNCEQITKELVSELTSPENLTDAAMMVPVDMRGVAGKVGKDFDNVDMMLEELGAKGTGGAFLAAAAYFDANEDNESEEERPQPMTAKEWIKILDDNEAAELKEEGLVEGKEEAGLCEGTEEAGLVEGKEEEEDGE